MKISDQYWAGLFDGEGWFQIARAKGSHNRSRREWSYQCHAALTIREKEIVDAMCDRFGGTVALQKSYSDNHSPYYKWQTTGLGAQKVAYILEPHLVAKKNQARVLQSFQAEKIVNGNKPVTDERYEFYGKCYDMMKVLNKRGVGKSIEAVLEYR